ncbi:MAG TPA: His/Gly/Thr/Pro-type tRNA ligase C-terminal domain-containing protein [Candidatus Paceibacterota bacterium]|nr:His/Gly/Thr/Pro-type tRNA ligase C-terminal domain-containing protein [Candidatus Paceibacterota bacterium]
MDITATDFCKRAITTAQHFGFQPLEHFKDHPKCLDCPKKLKSHASAADRRLDAMHGLVTGGSVGYTDYKLHALEEPVLFYSLEQVPRSGDVALSLQVFGAPKSIAEALLIQTSRALVEELGFGNHCVRINSMGDRDSVTRYTRELTNFMRKRIEDMPPTARELMKDHVLVALQHLIEKEHELAYRSPNAMEYLSDPARKHFRDIIEFLDVSETPYEIDPKLIGHHQCYSDALFTIDILDEDDQRHPEAPIHVSGGRYNHFTEAQVPGAPPAAGAVVVLRDTPAPKRMPRSTIPDNSAVYVVHLGFGPKVRSLMLVDTLRRAGMAVQHNLLEDSLSNQLRDAERKAVRYTLITGQKEFVDGTVVLRDMQARTQEAIPVDQIAGRLKRFNAVTVAA